MSWLHTHIVMPFSEPDRCSGLPSRLRAIRRFERMPEKAQRMEQQARLQRLLEHAQETVPYYRQLFKRAGFDPSQARTDRPLPLPALTREHLRTVSNSLLSTACAPEKRRIAASSGTTRAPIRFYRDVEGVRDKVALKLTLDERSGFYAGDSAMMLWGASSSMSRESNWKWRMYEGVFMRQTPPPPGIIEQPVLERWRWRLEKQRPKVIYGRATVLAIFAAYLQERATRHRPQTVIATAEVLSTSHRKLISSVFGSTPFNFYGSRDIGMVAAECSEHEGLHFHPWGSHVEFDPIGESPDGTIYRLLVTDLLNYAQPFILYDTGDCVTLTEQSCSCGRWFPLVRQVIGRVVEGGVQANGMAVPNITFIDRSNPIQQPYLPVPQVRTVRKQPKNISLGRKLRNRTLSA